MTTKTGRSMTIKDILSEFEEMRIKRQVSQIWNANSRYGVNITDWLTEKLKDIQLEQQHILNHEWELRLHKQRREIIGMVEGKKWKIVTTGEAQDQNLLLDQVIKSIKDKYE